VPEARAGGARATGIPLVLRVEVPAPFDDSADDDADRWADWLTLAGRALRRAAGLRSTDLRGGAPIVTDVERPVVTAGDRPARHDLPADPDVHGGAMIAARTGLAEALSATHWTSSPAANDALRVDLRNTTGGFRQATIAPVQDGACLSLDLASDLPDGAPSSLPDAVARLLLRTSGAVRLVRPFGRGAAGFGFEARLPWPLPPHALDLALSALSLAASMAGSEVEALASDAMLARSFLAPCSPDAGIPFGLFTI
jgi:hypothetical protein